MIEIGHTLGWLVVVTLFLVLAGITVTEFMAGIVVGLVVALVAVGIRTDWRKRRHKHHLASYPTASGFADRAPPTPDTCPDCTHWKHPCIGLFGDRTLSDGGCGAFVWRDAVRDVPRICEECKWLLRSLCPGVSGRTCEQFKERA